MKTPEECFKIANEYFENAKEILNEIEVKNDRYSNIKKVQKACGLMWLAVLSAIDGYLMKRGVKYENLPKTTDAYWGILKKYLVHNGKIIDAFDTVWDVIHSYGYYNGGNDARIIKIGVKEAKFIIEKLSIKDKNKGGDND